MAINQRGQLEPLEYQRFAGIRNTVAAERFEPGDLEAAVNVDIDDTGRLSRRTGWSVAVAAAGAHSLFSNGELCVFVQGTSLKRLLDLAGSTVALRTVTSGRRMNYAAVVNRLYYANGVETGVIEQGASRTWGIVPPAHVGQAAAAAGGALPAGTYQWTLTYLRNDGQESGALLAGRIELADNSGIDWTGLPVSSDPGVRAKMLYLTRTNGETFYEALVLDAADTTASYRNDGVELARPLETRHLQPPPAGQCLGYFRGQMLVAAGSVLYVSIPYGYELFDLRRYFDFESEVTLIAPVESGVFVCTQTHNYFLEGLTPEDWNRRVRTDAGAIPGTLVYVSGAKVGEGYDGVVALWLSRSGACLGTASGEFKILTAPRLRTNIDCTAGASIVMGGRVVMAPQ